MALTDSTQSNNSPLQRQLLSVIAIVTASMAVFGLNAPPSSTPDSKTEKKERVENLVTFDQRIWEDPFAQIAKAKRILSSQSKPASDNSSNATGDLQNGKLDDLLDILVELTFKQTVEQLESAPEPLPSPARLLVIFNLVKGSDLPENIENRIRIRHATEIALSNYQFRPLLADRISYVSIPNVSTHLTLQNFTVSSVEAPVRLYYNPQSDSKSNSKPDEYVLNVWLDQDVLGERPWQCLASILENVNKPKYDKYLKPQTEISFLGPVDSDTLKRMKPDERDGKRDFALKPPHTGKVKEGESSTIDRLEPFLDWKAIRWTSTSSTVPRSQLWGEDVPMNRTEPNRVPIEFKSIVDDDNDLIEVLTYELNTRLESDSIARRQLLLFVEQDQEYGRNLGRKLVENKPLFDAFDFKVIPYLRGLSDVKESPDLFSTGSAVSDYFQRTLARSTESWSYAEAESFKPAAIGILGGTWKDKMSLLGVIRNRFPQSLVFTNDCDVRYLDPKHLAITRNLIIASHEDLMPRVEKGGEVSSIAFRDEYQATHFIGLSKLIESVFPEAYKDGPKLLNLDDYGACVFEVANAGMLKLPAKKQEEKDSRHLIAKWTGIFTILGLFLFPFALVLCPLLRSLIGNDKNKSLQEQQQQDKVWTELLSFWAPTVSCILVFGFVLFCIAKLETAGIRFSNFICGVNVIPSILLLAITIPITFRKTFRREMGADGREEKASRIHARLATWRLSTPQLHLHLGPFRKWITQFNKTLSLSVRRMIIASLSLSVAFAGFLAWYWTDDVWLLQVGLLGTLTCILPCKKTTQTATAATILIGLSIGILRFFAYDYSLVPARDPMLRAVGSCCFIVAYWWLLIGLLKLILYYWRLKNSLRHASRVFGCLRESRVVDSNQSNELRELVTDMGELSLRISNDLGTLTSVGLLVCIARLPIFDAWGMSFMTWLTIILPMALPLVVAIFVRREASRFREYTSQYLERSLKKKEEDAAASNMDVAGIKELLLRVTSYDKGVFSPLERDPLINAGIAIVLAMFSGPHSEVARRWLSMFLI